MKKRYIFIIIILLLILIPIFYYTYRVKFDKREVVLVKNLKVEVNDSKKVSDFIKRVNGNIVNDYKIDTTSLGIKHLKLTYINKENIKVTYNFDVKVVDTTAPVVWVDYLYTVDVNSDINLVNSIMCGDNYDNHPKCSIKGKYNLNKVGVYVLKYIAIDSSNNKTVKRFLLNVVKPNKQNKDKKTYTKYSDIYNKYKTDKTNIWIDISKWQGDVDFSKLKEAHVEFVILRVGYSKGIDGEYELDPKFKQNIENAIKNDIPVGLYFYSYANSRKKAIEDAKWVISQIKDYEITYPIAFDWEEWKNYNEYKLSFANLTDMANAFTETIEKEGYKSLLYSSKNYLEKIWMENNNDIWLAYYTKHNNYKGKYKMWQLCDNGKVDGIDTDVDIDIYYK